MITDDTDVWYIIKLALFNNLNYYNDVVIDGISCRFTFEYNERVGTRYLSIVTASGTVLLSQTPLFKEHELYLDVNADLIGIHECMIKLVKLDNLIDDDLLNWSDNYIIYIKGVFDDVYEDYLDLKKSLVI
ncbi:hypothetical protein Phab24_id002 [Acinetobacter phage Phab24]|nr:hypothetical protein Phab24_id002 [Acinetobacter phage Phab24]